MTWTSPDGIEARNSIASYSSVANPHDGIARTSDIVMEIEGGGLGAAGSNPNHVDTTLNFTTAGQVVAISFDAIGRSLGLSSDIPDNQVQGFDVVWNGVTVGTFDAGTAAWMNPTIQVTSVAGNNTLVFYAHDQVAGHGISDIVDNIAVKTIGDGVVGSTVKLPTVPAPTFSDNDGSESHQLTLTDIPVGATVSDGSHSFTASSGNTTTTFCTTSSRRVLRPAARTGI